MTQEYTYMLLARLKSDCESYFEFGGSLWGVDPETHADKMYSLWNELEVKPEWLTRDQLEDMTEKLYAEAER